MRLVQKHIRFVQKESNYLLQEVAPDDNIIERLTQSFSKPHDCKNRPCLFCCSVSYSIGKCIRMKEEFEARVGALAMVSAKDGGTYMSDLKNKIKQEDGWKRMPNDEYPSLYEKVIYTEDLMRARKQGGDCLEGLASCADKYLQERSRGTLKREARRYSTIEEHIKARRDKEELDSLLS